MAVKNAIGLYNGVPKEIPASDMAIKKPLVLYGNKFKELQAGDTIAGTSSGGNYFQDSFKIGMSLNDNITNQNDSTNFAIKLALNDSNASQLESINLAFPSPDFGDLSSTPTENKSFLAKYWQIGSVGTGVTNPNNANGSNDGLFAGLQTQTAGSSAVTMLSNIGSSISNISLNNPFLYLYFKSSNVLPTSIGTITLKSSNALFSDIIIFSNGAANTTIDNTTIPLSYSLNAYSLLQIQSMRISYLVSDSVAGVSPHVMSVDAAYISINNPFN